VVIRARKVLEDLEAGRHLRAGGIDDRQMELSLVPEKEDPVIGRIRDMDPDSITPRRALEILYQLRDSVE